MRASRLGKKSGLIGLNHLGDDPWIGGWKVGAEYDALRRGHMLERAEGLLSWRERIVVPEMLEAGVDLLARKLRQARVRPRRHRKCPREVGNQPPALKQHA